MNTTVTVNKADRKITGSTMRGESEEEAAEEQHHLVSTPARTHHRRHSSRPAAIRRSGARTKRETASSSCSVRRGGKSRLVPQFASRPGRGAGAVTSIDGPFQGRARAAAPRAPPSNLGRFLHPATSTSAAAAAAGEQDGGFSKKGGRIRSYRPVNHHNNQAINPRSGQKPVEDEDESWPLLDGARLLAVCPTTE